MKTITVENPEDILLVTPDGRVFVDVEAFVGLNSPQVIEDAVKAQDKANEDGDRYGLGWVDGLAMMLNQMLDMKEGVAAAHREQMQQPAPQEPTEQYGLYL